MSNKDRRTAGSSRNETGASGSLQQDHSAEGSSRRKAVNIGSSRQKIPTRYSRNSKTISGRLHDELVMMDPEQGKYFSLNPVATRIWDLLEKPMSEEDLCVHLTDEYDVEPERCMDEVKSLLERMVMLGLVVKLS